MYTDADEQKQCEREHEEARRARAREDADLWDRVAPMKDNARFNPTAFLIRAYQEIDAYYGKSAKRRALRRNKIKRLIDEILK